MHEEWRDIKGFEGLYQVSNLGRVKSLRRNKIMAQRNRRGYMAVGLRKNGQKTYSVHRLVALAFIPNPKNYPQVNHKDECKTNNNVDNLEWCDAKYNSNYGTHILRVIQNTDYSKIDYKARHEHTNYTERYKHTDYTNIKASTKERFSHKVIQYTMSGEIVKEWLSLRDIEKELKWDRKIIAKCCKGARDNYRGYKWKYASA